MLFSENDNCALDKVLVARKSVRRFTDAVPPRELVEQILEAGRLAPFSGIANAGLKDFRRFFVIPQGSPRIESIRAMVVENLRRLVAELEPQMAEHPERSVALARWKQQIEVGPRGIGNAPWFIIAAEHRGYPTSEMQSLSCLAQNMWLKATALGLGMHWVSHIRNLGMAHEGICSLLGIRPGAFGLNACSIGYPAEGDSAFRTKPRDVPVPDVTWLD